jgi:hypothetical protein
MGVRGVVDLEGSKAMKSGVGLIKGKTSDDVYVEGGRENVTSVYAINAPHCGWVRRLSAQGALVDLGITAVWVILVASISIARKATR